MIVKEIEKKQCSIDLLHSKIKHLNSIDKTDTLKNKKNEEPKELENAKNELIKAIKNFHSELVDNIIVERENLYFDFRIENCKQQSKISLGSIIALLISEEEILRHCHEKVDRTIKRIEEGYYEK